MTATIVWVDEDERIWAPERRLLAGLGYEVQTIGDASSALNYFLTMETTQVQLAIFDIMLLQGDNPLFSDDATDKGLNAGLLLAEEVLKLCPVLQPKVLLFSRASKPTHLTVIKARAEAMRIKYLSKSGIHKV